jgi:hypothetical protein
MKTVYNYCLKLFKRLNKIKFGKTDGQSLALQPKLIYYLFP